MDSAIKIINVNKKYDGFSLTNASMTLPKGCIMGVIGENGAGKSTLIKIILDLVKSDSGEIYIMGHDNLNMQGSLKEKIGVVFDESFFPENLNIKQIGLILKNIYKQWDEEEFTRHISKFELPVTKPVKEFSRGMKMKLSFAAALSHGAELLILDEAASGLDPMAREGLLDLLSDFTQDEKKSVLISSHIISDLEKVCDYITFINKGKIIFSEEKDLLREKYRLVKGDESELLSIPGDALKGIRRGKFGSTALVLSENIPKNLVSDPADIESIMVFHSKKEYRI
ncbi:MAG: ABC transporter ATP-binding protein [Eubacteriales bacterium]|nr:ABC transporter ATP-binding protein [Eubacteriales bacterium]